MPLDLELRSLPERIFGRFDTVQKRGTKRQRVRSLVFIGGVRPYSDLGLMRDLKLDMMRKHGLQCSADFLREPLVLQHDDDHLMEVSALDQLTPEQAQRMG